MTERANGSMGLTAADFWLRMMPSANSSTGDAVSPRKSKNKLKPEGIETPSNALISPREIPISGGLRRILLMVFGTVVGICTDFI